MGLNTNATTQQVNTAINTTLQTTTQIPAGASGTTNLLVNGTTAHALYLAHNNSQPRVSESRVEFHEQPLTARGGQVSPGTADPLALLPATPGSIPLSLQPDAQGIPVAVVVPAIDTQPLGLSDWRITPPQLHVSSVPPTVTLGSFNATPIGESEQGNTDSTNAYVNEVLLVGLGQLLASGPHLPPNGD